MAGKNAKESAQKLESEKALMKKNFPDEFKKAQSVGRVSLWLWMLFVVAFVLSFGQPAFGLPLLIVVVFLLIVFGRINKRLRRDLLANLAAGQGSSSPKEGIPCIACAEIIKNDASLCRFCGTDQSTVAEPAVAPKSAARPAQSQSQTLRESGE